MKTTIEIIQRDDDKTDYFMLIVEGLNRLFSTKESMELRWELNCLEVVQELRGIITFSPITSVHSYTVCDFRNVY